MLSTIFSGTDDLIVIVVALVVIFGGTQLPKLARNAGEAMREFRKAGSEAKSTIDEVNRPVAAPPPPAVLPAQGNGALSAGAVAPEDRVTLSREELDALLAAREAKVRSEQADQKP